MHVTVEAQTDGGLVIIRVLALLEPYDSICRLSIYYI